jgi:hypothetical protein
MTMRMEWLRAGDGTPACWACFLVYPDKVSVLATLTNGLVDRVCALEVQQSRQTATPSASSSGAGQGWACSYWFQPA